MQRVGADGDGVRVSFEATDAGVEVFDPIERHRCTLGTGCDVRPEAASPEGFPVPVDDAVSLDAGTVSTPNVVAAYVRDGEGALVAEAEHDSEVRLPAGTYTVELTTPVKTYLRGDGPLTVSTEGGRTTVDFEETRLLLGARSRHQRPAATVTTTDDPRDVMAAVSTLGSALKTTSPERSYPTLRGHPPVIERGDELHIPEGIERPETGVRIELPPQRRYIYPAASLAYYLGAEVVPGSEPRIVTDRGFAYPLDVPDYETAVVRTLKQVFFLDCVVRTEGLYTVALHERTEIESATDIDPEALYDAPLAERLEAYLDVPWETVATHVPEWKLTTHLEAAPDAIEMVPFLVDDLAVIRSPSERSAAAAPDESAQEAAIGEFVRDGDFTRSAGEAGASPDTVVPADTDSLESAWAGDGVPAGASKPSVAAFKNRLEREPASGDIEVTVVCNEEAMDTERDVVESAYGGREGLPLSVTVHHELDTDELREVLASPNDFLHYIGHIDDEGFECADGRLDAQSLTEVGVDAFLLNACQSYEQGSALIDAGAIGGVVTLRDVVNEGAVGMGCTLARLLNRGFPLRAALDLAGDESAIGHQYSVLGDGGLSIAQAESGTPQLYEIEPNDDGTYALRIKTYPTSDRGIGSLIIPFLDANEEYYLSSGTIDEFDVSASELSEYLLKENAPTLVNGELHWAHDLELPL